MDQQPDGIIITVSKAMIGENGYRHWLRNFFYAMNRSENDENYFYWLRQGNRPKSDKNLRFVYLCIGNKIRFRAYYAGSEGEGVKHFDNHDDPMFGKAWILISGPILRPSRPIPRKGFQGFRYTTEIF